MHFLDLVWVAISQSVHDGYKEIEDVDFRNLQFLFVSKEWRKFGIGRNLILKALNELIALGIKESR